jgi:hypothetical protein
MRSLITDDSFDKLIGWRDLVRFGVDRSSRGFCQRNGVGKMETPRNNSEVGIRRAGGRLEERLRDGCPAERIHFWTFQDGWETKRQLLVCQAKVAKETDALQYRYCTSFSICTLDIHHT